MLLTQKDVAKHLGVSARIVAECTRAGILNHVLLPGHRKPRYTQKHVDDFLKRSEQCPNANGYLKT
jgi:hypothetical protein